MKSESKIRAKLNDIVDKMKDNKEKMHVENCLIYKDEMNKQIMFFNDVHIIYWILDEPVPQSIFDLV